MRDILCEGPRFEIKLEVLYGKHQPSPRRFRLGWENTLNSQIKNTGKYYHRMQNVNVKIILSTPLRNE